MASLPSAAWPHSLRRIQIHAPIVPVLATICCAMKKHIIAPAFLALAAACSAPAPVVHSGPARALPASFHAEMFNAGMASAIADECRSLRFNRSYENAVIDVLAEELVTKGYTEYDIDVGIDSIDESELQSEFFDYVEAKNIVISDRSTWCAAGHGEVRADSRIGRYLIAT